MPEVMDAAPPVDGRPHRAARVAARWRIPITRVLAVGIVASLLLTGPGWVANGLADQLCDLGGFILVVVAVLGRLWTLSYICGRKNAVLVQDGPYSVTRNPLYLFSLAGALGIALSAGNLLMAGAVMVLFAVYYPLVVASEEAELERRHRDAFTAYRARVPRFLPRLSLYREAETQTLPAARYRLAFLDAMWFLWGFAAVQAVERLQEAGVLHVLVSVP